jgi:murein DD-endopeptidase MepM/ murein hydrolase activator NlpD
MSLEHDKRARRPPAKEVQSEGFGKPSGMTISDDGGLDLRIGQQKLELGRNPRGEPVSVSKSIAQYKEAQARRFAEHGVDSIMDMPANNIEADSNGISVDGTRSSVMAEIIQARDTASGSSVPDRITLNHEKTSRFSHDRQGQLQSIRNRTPDAPVDNIQKSSTQQDSEKYIAQNESNHAQTIAPVISDLSVVISTTPVVAFDPVVPLSDSAADYGTGNQLTPEIVKHESKVSLHEHTERIAVDHNVQRQPGSRYTIEAEKEASKDIPAQSGSTRTTSPDAVSQTHIIAPATPMDSGVPINRQSAHRITDVSVHPPSEADIPVVTADNPDGVNTLSHKREQSISHEQKGLLKTSRSRTPEVPKGSLRKSKTQRASEDYIQSGNVNQTRATEPIAATGSDRAPLVHGSPKGIPIPVIDISDGNDVWREAKSKLRFTDDETELDVDAGDITETEEPSDTAMPEEQELAEPIKPSDPDTLIPQRDSFLSHERTSRSIHERPGRLQHNRAPVAEAAILTNKAVQRNKPLQSTDSGQSPTVVSSTEAPRLDAENRTDWRRNAPSVTPADADRGDIVVDDDASVDTPASEPKRDAEHDSIADAGTAGEAASESEHAASTISVPGDTPVTPTVEASGTSQKPTPSKHDSKSSAQAHVSESGDKNKKKTGKLRFEDETVSTATKKSNTKLDKAVDKADRSAEKLAGAREKLPKKRVLRTGREFDAEKGKFKQRLRFEKEVKTPREHLRGPALTRPVKTGANIAIGYAHKKMFQVEDDNVAVKAAHRGEMLTEHGVRSVYRFAKDTPYRKVRKLERKTAKLNIKAEYQKVLHENPDLKKTPVTRMMQKRKIKKNYAKAARDAQRAGQKTAAAAKKTAEVAGKAAAKVKAALANPKVLLIAGLLFLVIFLLFGFISSCTSISTSLGGYITATSYLAEEDADIDNAELYYTEIETDLSIRIKNTESEFSGYDEYRYQIGDISHNPYELMAFLTAVYGDFTYSGVQPVLAALFAEQYTLTHTPSVEIRYRTETRTDSWTDDEGNTYSDTYEVEVPYEWHILSVTLTSRPFTDVVYTRMDAEQQQHYSLLMRSKGNRQYAQSPFDFNWLPYVSSYYGYRVHPITGAKDYHMGIDIAQPTGTDIIAAQTGTVTFAGDLGGYGLVVVIEGSDGLETKYAHCDTLLVSMGQTVTVGDVIATVGNTGSSTGPHLHFEVVKNGRYLNPIFFALTNDDGSGQIPPGMPGGVIIPPYSGEPMGDGSFAALLAEAERHLGKPYVFGANGPDSFDCSSYICWILTYSGVRDTPRTTAQGLFNMCTPVALLNAEPGDLLFFHSTYSTTDTVTHVALYLGGDLFLHAGNPIGYGNLGSSYWQEHFYAVGRMN